MAKRLLGFMMCVCLCFCFGLLGLTGCDTAEKASDNDALIGTWYESSGGMMEVVIFDEDGTCYRTLEEYVDDPEQDEMSYAYDKEAGTLQFELDDHPAKAVLEEDKLTYTYEEYDEVHVLYRDREAALLSDPAYYTADAFTDTIIDDNGFCIKDGVLYAYRGEAEEIIVPANVKVIYMEAFAGDFNHGVNLEKVIIPGTVEEIQSHAFAFTNADVIILEEGVKTIDDFAFMDSYIDEIHFPASLNEIGDGIMETEEGLDDTKIYVPADSKIESYFEEQMPYGGAELIKE